jgi:hypothetical protein
MTQAVAVRSQGDDFQARMFWLHAALLLDPKGAVSKVSFERGPRGFDDVTVEYAPGMGPQDHYGHRLVRDFLQCKWHARPGEFGHLELIDPAFSNAQTVSLLQRARDAQAAHAPQGKGARFRLVTNWRLMAADPLAKLILNQTHAIDVKLLYEGKTSASVMGKVRDAWAGHLGISHDELEHVARTLAITQRLESGNDFRERLNDRFALVGMMQVPLSQAGFPYDDLIMKLHAQERNEFDRDSFRELCNDEKLLDKKGDGPSTLGVRSFMHPIDDLEARTDKAINLVPHFDGRYIRDPSAWKAVVFPELRDFVINAARGQDEIRLILDTHVSLAFGVGAILNAKSGKKIELEQRAGGRQIWSESDKPVDALWPKLVIAREAVHAGGADIAVSVGLTHDTSKAVRAYAENLPDVGELLIATPDGGSSNQSMKSGSHAFQLAEALTATIRSTGTGPRRVHLFIAGPNAFAFFLGQNQPAIGPMSVYEWDFDGLRDRNYSLGLELP